jgi:hypothetical protein
MMKTYARVTDDISDKKNCKRILYPPRCGDTENLLRLAGYAGIDFSLNLCTASIGTCPSANLHIFTTTSYLLP